MPKSELDKYKSMRDFSKTSEPAGGKPSLSSGGKRTKQATFVIQKHAATALHYDVRFQVGDVMPSWAVPKGPSFDPKVRRLAVQTEDHPLDYQHFEGGIPKGEYGGGEVIIWDRGTYERVHNKPGPVPDMRDSINEGHFTVAIHGEKLEGQWSFIRTGINNGKSQWVMVKHKDDYVDTKLDITKSRPESVISGKTIEEMKLKDNKSKSKWVAPMLASIPKAQPTGPGWIYERKLDGLRCVAIRKGNKVDLWSRNQLSFNARFPKIIEELQALPIDDFVLDGEIVAFDTKGHTSFSLLQQGKHPKPELHIFDVLHLLGQDTTGLTLTERKELLSKAIEDTDVLKLVPEETGDPTKLLDKAKRKGWEGLVAKRADGKYISGRSGSWVKMKVIASQELVVGGWTEPRNSRVGFGALLLGYNDDSGFRYAGKVGTGFNTELLESLLKQMQKLERKTSPFIDEVKEKTAHWVKPELVANIAFTEWTNDGRLRHPAFEGLRPDKKAAEVVREQ